MSSTTVTIGIVASAASAVSAFSSVAAAGRGLGSTLQGVGGQMAAVGAAGSLFAAPIIAGIAGATKVAGNFRTELSGASRALDLTKAETDKFGATILSLAPKLGILPVEFAKLATEAGKLGVAKNEIEAFSVVIAKVSAATDVSATKLANYGAVIKNIFGLNTKELEAYFGAVNKLDDSVGGSTETISDFVNRVGATGKLAGLSAKELAALGASFNALGISSERGATASNNLLGKITAVGTLSPNAKKAVTEMGFTVDQLQASMAKDGQKGLLTVLERLKTFAPSKQLELATRIFGRESADEILTLVAGLDKYKQGLNAIGNDAGNVAKLNDEMQKKLAASSATFQASMQALGISLGSALLPALNMVLAAATPVINKFAEFARANPTITAVGVAVVGLTAVIFPLLAVVGSAIAAIGTIVSGVTAAIGVLTGLGGILGVVGAAFAFLLSPVGLTLVAFAAVGAAAGAIIAHWSRIAPFFGNLWNQLSSGAMNAGSRMLSALQSAGAAVINYLASLPGRAFQAGMALGDQFAQGIQSTISKATAAIASVTSAVRQYLPFSPAKEGALRDLDRIQLVETIAANITSQPLTSALNNALGDARSTLATPMAASASGGGANAGGGVTITYSPQIDMAVGNDSDQLMQVLREHSRELVDILNQAGTKFNRVSYT